MSGASATAERDRVRQDPDPRPAPPHRPDDVRLQAEVDDRDERPAILRPADVHDRRRRHLADEVLVLPARHGPRPVDGGVAVDEPGLRDDRPEAAARPEVPGEGSRVDARDRRDALAAEQRRELADVVDDGGRRVRDDERPEPRPDGLVVVGDAPVVADQRVGHHDDLAGVRGIGADLLVAGLRGVDDEVAAGRRVGPERDPGEHRPVLERQQRRTALAHPRVDDRARPGERRMDPRRRRVDRHRRGPDMKTPPARRARWTRGHTRSASFPASRDRYAGLTGPAIKDSRRVPPGVRPMARRRAPEVRSGVLGGSRAVRRTVGDGTFGPAIRCQRAPTVAQANSVASVRSHIRRASPCASDVGAHSALSSEVRTRHVGHRSTPSGQAQRTRRAASISPSRSRSGCRRRW